MSKEDSVCLNSLSCNKGDNIILDNVSFKVNHKEALVILGPGGSGKTTMLNILSSLQDQDIRFSAVNFQVLSNFSYFKQQDVFLNKTFEDVFNSYNLNIHVELIRHWQHHSIVDELYHYAMETWNGIPKKYTQLLRITLFLSRSQNAKTLLLDEPDAHLHEDLDILVDKIKELKKNRIIIIVSHNIEFTKNIADQIMYLSYGKVIEYSNTHEFLNSENEDVKYILKLGC